MKRDDINVGDNVWVVTRKSYAIVIEIIGMRGSGYSVQLPDTTGVSRGIYRVHGQDLITDAQLDIERKQNELRKS
jgi:hypothetical protein